MTIDPNIIQRICCTIAAVMNVPATALSEATRQESVRGWDSLAHVQLVLGLESEFGVSFTIDQAVGLTSVRAIHAAVCELVQHAT
jgi:acyl carrier protein